MIIKNNKKCNIKINDKNIEAYKKENISDYVPELKEFENNGLKLNSISSDGYGNMSFIFEKRIEDKSVMTVNITIFHSEENLLDLLKSQLEGFYDKKQRNK